MNRYISRDVLRQARATSVTLRQEIKRLKLILGMDPEASIPAYCAFNPKDKTIFPWAEFGELAVAEQQLPVEELGEEEGYEVRRCVVLVPTKESIDHRASSTPDECGTAAGAASVAPRGTDENAGNSPGPEKSSPSRVEESSDSEPLTTASRGGRHSGVISVLCWLCIGLLFIFGTLVQGCALEAELADDDLLRQLERLNDNIETTFPPLRVSPG